MQSRPYRVDASSAKPFTYSYDSSKSAFSISLDGKRLNVLSKTSHYVSGDSKYANNLSYYNIYEIVESAAASVSYKFFDTSDKEITALAKNGVAITEGSTVASLSGVTIPSYVNATYYTDAKFTSEVTGTSTPEADKTYYVKTRYKSGMPFVLGGTYFALGNGNNYLYNHGKASGNDQYAIKMSGDWYNGFVVQDSSDKYLSDADGTFSGTVDSKLQIELTGDNYFLKSVSKGNYISLSANAVSYVTNIAFATPLSNLSETKAREILADYPAARYVGTYSSTQTDVAFDDIVKGKGKIEREDRALQVRRGSHPGGGQRGHQKLHRGLYCRRDKAASGQIPYRGRAHAGERRPYAGSDARGGCKRDSGAQPDPGQHCSL